MNNFRRWMGILGIVCLLMGMSLGAGGQEEEISWPRSLKAEKHEVILYQPQVESLEGNMLESRAAVAIKEEGVEGMVFGAMRFEAQLATDYDTRLATLEKIRVSAAKFPDMEPEAVEKLSRFLEREIPQWDLTLSIDRLLADLADDAGMHQGDKAYQNKPPVIYYRTSPTVLVLVDGDPIFTELNGYELDYVANSAFFIVKDRKSKLHYLRGGGLWFVADDLGGPWKMTTDLPTEVGKVSQKVEDEEKTMSAEAAEDAEVLGAEKNENEAPPEIILSTEPAELIVTEGEMDFASIESTQLLYLKNTESDVVMDIATQQYYLLLSGRWFRSKSLTDGPWDFVAFDDLPDEFASIPADSDLATVLPSVPGTQESKEAVLETQIPQTAEVDRKTATCEVTYDGDPEFEECGDGVAYALNTESSVLLIDQKYYCVDEAVWFVSGGPEGPWQVATEVPAVVQDLPPDCPVYNVKYVYIYESTPEVVYVGYTSGYYGSYVYGPCVIYGTGWYYRPWWGHYYYPRAVTYGWGVHYNPYSGWGFSFGASYGWLHVGVGWGRPYYGCWGAAGYRHGYRHGYWRGYNRGYSNGYRRGAAAGYRAGYRAGQNQPHSQNAYRNRSSGVNRTGDVGLQAGRQPSTSDRKNNVYTDRDGNVYRDKDGSWEKRDQGEWSAEDRSKDGDRSRDDQSREDRAGDQTRDQDKARDQDRSGDSQTRDSQTRDQSRDQQSRDQDRSRDQQQSRDRSQSTDRNKGGSSQQQLDRDRSSRSRGNERQRQSPSRGGGGRGGGGRGGGRR